MKSRSVSERVGYTLGRWVRPIVRLESKLWRSIATAGIPDLVVQSLKWATRVALLLVLLYISVIPAMVAVFLVLMSRPDSGYTGSEEFEPSCNSHYDMDLDEQARKARHVEEQDR